MSVSSLLLVSLGGTISLSLDQGRAVSGDNRAALLEGLQNRAPHWRWTTHALMQKDSADLTLDDLAGLARYIHMHSDAHNGVIVTTGTDTLEEVAFFLHEVFGAREKIIVTGAMRPPYDEAFDGIENLHFAGEQFAAHSNAPPGVYVAMSGALIPAASARKASAYHRDAFAPLFRNGTAPVIASETVQTDFLFSDEARLPGVNVPVLAASIGASFELDWFEKMDGCVIACPGAFSLPEREVARLAPVARQKPIVLASRCLHHDARGNDLYPGYMARLEGEGFVIRDYLGLSPQQAQIRLGLRLMAPKGEA